MKIVKNILISVTESDLEKGVFTNKKVTEVADGCFNDLSSLVKVVLPKVKKIGSDCFRSNQALTEISLPALTTAGSYCFSYNQALTEISLPALTTAGSYCFSYNQALTEISLPALTTAGSDCFRSNQALTEISLPALTTAGSYCFRYNQALTEISLRNKTFKSKCVDDYPFIIESEKTSKGIKIYSGFNLNKIDKNKIDKTQCFVAEKAGFTAHGESMRDAVNDLQFKIVAEKLKKDPINKDTMITIEYYRIITGACKLGVADWMQKNGIKKAKIKASELLPILRKTNAWGVSNFEKLITF